MATSLIDSFGRRLDYLRISVTPQCNFRCVYCIPAEGIPLPPQSDLLSLEEILRVARLFLEMGGRKIKLTGGEPLLYPEIVSLVARLSHLGGLSDLGLTTNGFYLEERAEPLFEAGLRRVNVSLDATNPRRFAALTRSLSFRKVWRGIQAALSAGLKLKLNVVALKGLTAEEMQDFAFLAQEHPLEVRFIEFMPLCGSGWHPEWRFPLEAVEKFFRENYRLVPLLRGSATAKTYQLADGVGKIGFIASMTEPFCESCSRLRLTADGKLRPCLFSNREIDLRSALKNGASDEEIKKIIGEAVLRKPAGHGISPDIPDASGLPKIRALGG